MQFSVDMDKVAPLGISSAPPTARSGSSSGTSRTGGGTTARSDGKGTPRDCERIPLAELGRRPSTRDITVGGSSGAASGGLVGLGLSSHGNGLFERRRGQSDDANGGEMPLSPMNTARSGVMSSPGSSQGLSSSRSYSEPYFQGQQSGQSRPGWVMDISREIEVMRHVILQENHRLREQYREGKQSLMQLRQRFFASDPFVSELGEGDGSSSSGGSGVAPANLASEETTVGSGGGGEPCGRLADAVERPLRALRPRRVVEWRIAGVDVARAAALDAWSDRFAFELPEYPGVAFGFAFGNSSTSKARRANSKKEAVALEESPCATSSEGDNSTSKPGVVIKPASTESARADNAKPSGACRLKLRVSGPGCANLCMLIDLEAEMGQSAEAVEAPAGIDSTLDGVAGGVPAAASVDASIISAGGHVQPADLCSSGGGGYPSVAVAGASPPVASRVPSAVPPVADASERGTSLGSVSSVLLRSGGRVSCVCNIPVGEVAKGDTVGIVCRAVVEFAGFVSDGEGRPLRLVTRCKAPLEESKMKKATPIAGE